MRHRGRRLLIAGSAVALVAVSSVLAAFGMREPSQPAVVPTALSRPIPRPVPTCTRTLPAGKSVEAAIAALDAGQTLCLEAGATFRQDVTVRGGGAPGAPVTITSAPGAAATLVGRLVIAADARHVAVTDLMLDGRNATRLPSPTIGGRDVMFARNEITNRNTAICVTIGSAEGFGVASRVELRANRIHHCGRLPATNRDHGVYVESARDTLIVGNLIHDNADRGIQLYPDARGTLVAGNVIDGNGVGIIFSGEGDLASTGNLVTGNLIGNSRDRHDVEAFWPPDGVVGTDNRVTGNCIGGGRLGAVGEQVGFHAVDNAMVALAYTDRVRFGLRADHPCASFVPPIPEGLL